jgi:PhnB protein
MSANSIPKGYHSVTPYLYVLGVSKLIEFLKNAFDATEIERMSQPDGVVVHAVVKIGDSIIMMGEASGKNKPMPAMLYLYVNDVDTFFKRALDAGATSVREPRNEFYGDRTGGIKDPSGNQWWIATHVEDLSAEELKKREKEFLKQNH